MECEIYLEKLARTYREYLATKRELKRIAEIIGFPEELVRRLPVTMLFARAKFKDDVICYTHCYDLKDWLEKMDKYIELGNDVRSLFKAVLYYCEKEGKI